jgi:hypothetical protein
MARAGSACIVRDDRAGTAPGNAGKLCPHTLNGLADALDDPRFSGYAGPPRVVLVTGESGLKLTRPAKTAGKSRPRTRQPD